MPFALVACTSQPIPAQPTPTATVEIVATVPATDTPVPTLMPQPTKTATPTTEPSPTPEPSATPAPTATPIPTPEIQVAEGEVVYEYVYAKTGEEVRVALPELWANMLEKATDGDRVDYRNFTTVAKREIVGNDFLVDGIRIATKDSDGVWQRNPELFQIEDHLSFGPGIAISEDLGSVDPSTIDSIHSLVHKDILNATLDGNLGVISLSYIDRVTIVSAERTRILLVSEDQLVKTAVLDATFAFRYFEGSEPVIFSAKAYDTLMANGQFEKIADMSFSVGELYRDANFTYLVAGSNGGRVGLEERNAYALENDTVFRFDGTTHMQQESSGFNFTGNHDIDTLYFGGLSRYED